MNWDKPVKITGRVLEGALDPEKAAQIDAVSFDVTRGEWRRFLFEAVTEDANSVMRAHDIYGGARRIVDDANSGRLSLFLQALTQPEEERQRQARQIEIAELTVRLIDACDAVGVHVIGVEGDLFREMDRGRFSEPAPGPS